MSYPSTKRLRRSRGIAAAVALLTAGAGLIASPAAQAVPTPEGPAGWIRTMAGMTRNFTQGGYGPDSTPEMPIPATQSQISNPRGLNFAPAGSPNAGDLYFTDALNHMVRRIDSAGNIWTVAGTAPINGVTQPGEDGEGVPATQAHLREPHGVAVDSKGNVYIADSRNCVVRKVDTNGVITRFAGTGQRKPTDKDPYNCGQSAVDPQVVTDPLTVALDQPKQLFITQEGDKDVLWITDMGNNMLRRIDINNGVAEKMTRVAGVRMNNNFRDGDSTMATMRHAEGIWVANDGTIYFTDGGNNLVRRIVKGVGNSWTVSTIAGDKAAAEAHALQAGDLPGNSDGDGGLAINAHLDEPRGITGDNQGNLFIAEEHGSRIRKINLVSGIINTIAGDGTVAEQRKNGGSAFIRGENGPALETQFNHLHDMQVNPADGSLWIADSRNNRIRAMYGVSQVQGGNVQTGGNPGANEDTPPPVASKSGYWMLGEEGKVYAFGDATSFGDAVGRMPAGAKAVHIEPTPSQKGYWINDSRGGVYAFGDANGGLGGISASQLRPGETVTSLSSTPSGQGYWLFTSLGRVFTKGDAGNFGDLANVRLNGAIQSSVPTPSGKGYYMVGSDGGVFTFGDAKFHGSTGNIKLNKPVMSLVPTGSGGGYWLVATDGGIFSFGDAGFKGSLGSVKLNKPIVGMVRYGAGYLMVGSDGGIFDFSGGPGFKGSLGANPPAIPIVFAATLYI